MLKPEVKTYELLVWTYPDLKEFGLGIVWSPLLKYSAKTAEVILDSTDSVQLHQRKRDSGSFHVRCAQYSFNSILYLLSCKWLY